VQRSLRTCLLRNVIPNLRVQHSEFILSQLYMKYPNAPFVEKVTQDVPLRTPTNKFPEATAWSPQKFSPQAYTHEFPKVNTRSSNIKSNGVSCVVTWFAKTRPATRVLQFFTNVCHKDPLDTHHVYVWGKQCSGTLCPCNLKSA